MNKILYFANYSSQGRSKISFTGMKSPKNQTRKNPFYLYSLSPHLPQFQPGSLLRSSLYAQLVYAVLVEKSGNFSQ